MLADDTLDEIRILAAEALGDNADSTDLVGVLQDAAKARPWNTRGLRSAANHAIGQIKDRVLAKRGAAS